MHAFGIMFVNTQQLRQEYNKEVFSNNSLFRSLLLLGVDMGLKI